MKHKSAKMVMSLIISLLFVLEIIPMNVFAALNTENMNLNVSEIKNDEVPNVVAEIVEERDEFSKVYLLEDGSYYSVTTYAPIHKKVNEEWENIDKDLDVLESKMIETIEETLQQVSMKSFEEHSVRTLSDVYAFANMSNTEINSSLTTKNFNCTPYPGGTIRFKTNSVMLVKPNVVNNFLSENKVILEANLVIPCSVGANNSIDARLYAKEIKSSWSNNTSINALDSLGGRNIDCVNIDSDGEYKIDITETFSRWESGETSNNGIMLFSKETCDFTISPISLSIRYEMIDENDTDYTYHTIDMDKAGQLFVNDYTNTIRLEQNILGVKSTVLPININRYYSSIYTSFSNAAGIGMSWNYSSNILYSDELVTWNLFDGSVRRFKKPNTNELVVNGNYEKWIENGNYIGDASLWVETGSLSNPIIDYSKMYIELDGVKYEFDVTGNLIKIKYNEIEEIDIDYSIANDVARIDSISNRNYCFSFTYDSDINDVGAKHIKTIVLEELETNEPITVNVNEMDETEYKVDFVTSYNWETGISTNKTIYFDGSFVVYEYDYNGNLLAVNLNDTTRWELIYRDENSVVSNCRRLEKCIKYELVNGEKPTGDQGEIMLSVDSTKTYQRDFTSENLNETIYFDRNANVISHKMSDGRYLFANYDNNGLLSSYVVSEKNPAKDFLSNPGFENEGNVESGWMTESGESYISYLNTDSVNDAQEFGQRILQIDADDYFAANVIQKCVGTFEADQTYVFGAWIKMNDGALSSHRNGLKINIYEAENDGNCNKNKLITSMSFDTCSTNEWQYKLAAFKLEESQSTLYFSIEYDGPGANIKIDNAKLYKAEISDGDVPGVITSTCGVVVKNEDGSVNREILSDDVISMIKSYTYGSDGNVASITDYNGITTYYKYNSSGLLEELGTIKSGDTIVNPTKFAYLGGLRESIQQEITNISTGANVNMATHYTYNGDKIESVIHNGVSYIFEYSSDGSIKRVYSEFVNDEGTNSTIDLMDYSVLDSSEDTTTNIINYANNLQVVYTFNNDEIVEVKYLVDEKIYKIVSYSYDSNNNLTVSDSKTGYDISYTSNGYKLYRNNEGNRTLLYELERNDDSETIETFFPEIYSVDSTPKVLITTGKTTTDFNSINKSTTKSSDVTFEKIRDWTDSVTYDAVSYSYKRQSVTDYFGRVTQKSIESKSVNSAGELTRVKEQYSYKDVSSGITSTLVSSYATSFEMINSEDNSLRTVYSSEVFYDYDINGNIVYEYTKNLSGEDIPK